MIKTVDAEENRFRPGQARGFLREFSLNKVCCAANADEGDAERNLK